MLVGKEDTTQSWPLYPPYTTRTFKGLSDPIPKSHHCISVVNHITNRKSKPRLNYLKVNLEAFTLGPEEGIEDINPTPEGNDSLTTSVENCKEKHPRGAENSTFLVCPTPAKKSTPGTPTPVALTHLLKKPMNF